MADLAGKVAIVTGDSFGIGEAEAMPPKPASFVRLFACISGSQAVR